MYFIGIIFQYEIINSSFNNWRATLRWYFRYLFLVFASCITEHDLDILKSHKINDKVNNIRGHSYLVFCFTLLFDDKYRKAMHFFSLIFYVMLSMNTELL